MLITILKRWIPLAFVACCLCGLVYGAVQQSYRQSANDPQIELAEDTANTLAAGAQTGTVVPPWTINIASSVSPYLVVYDESGQPVAGDGMLQNALPSLPSGIFDSVRAHGEDRVTWAPMPGVRSAIVVTHIGGASGGFVMAGQSLREVEKRESSLTLMVAIALIVTLVGSFLLVLADERWWSKK